MNRHMAHRVPLYRLDDHDVYENDVERWTWRRAIAEGIVFCIALAALFMAATYVG